MKGCSLGLSDIFIFMQGCSYQCGKVRALPRKACRHLNSFMVRGCAIAHGSHVQRLLEKLPGDLEGCPGHSRHFQPHLDR